VFRRTLGFEAQLSGFGQAGFFLVMKSVNEIIMVHFYFSPNIHA